MPGVGSTVLEIHCDMKERGEVIGVADARRTVEAGDGYTIGAWRTVFSDVANDVVADVAGQLGKE